MFSLQNGKLLAGRIFLLDLQVIFFLMTTFSFGVYAQSTYIQYNLSTGTRINVTMTEFKITFFFKSTFFSDKKFWSGSVII